MPFSQLTIDPTAAPMSFASVSREHCFTPCALPIRSRSPFTSNEGPELYLPLRPPRFPPRFFLAKLQPPCVFFYQLHHVTTMGREETASSLPGGRREATMERG